MEFEPSVKMTYQLTVVMCLHTDNIDNYGWQAQDIVHVNQYITWDIRQIDKEFSHTTSIDTSYQYLGNIPLIQQHYIGIAEIYIDYAIFLNYWLL